jgi:plasmid replication initiation protein
MNKEYLVTKSNYFIMNSSYDLSLQEQKIILTLASMVQPDDEEFKIYKFSIKEFMKLVGVNTKTKYTELPKITKELMKKVFEIEEGKKILQVAWLSSAAYEKGSGYVELEFSPRLKPYMLKLNTMFTQYKLDNILNMKSKYSSRIYELLKCNEFKKQGYIEIELKELRKMLKAEIVYPLYANFKQKLLIVSQKELREKTDISFEFEDIKTSRKVTSIKFIIHSTGKNKTKGEAINETAATIEKEPSNDLIKQVQAICHKHKIKEHEASCILGDANNNIDLIKQCYEYLLNKDNVKNIVGYMRKLVIGFDEPQSNNKVDRFNDYPQREYNFEELEKNLLGSESN